MKLLVYEFLHSKHSKPTWRRLIDLALVDRYE
jgi:hypothetical protein